MKGKQLQGCTSVLNSEKDRREHQGGVRLGVLKRTKRSLFLNHKVNGLAFNFNNIILWNICMNESIRHISYLLMVESSHSQKLREAMSIQKCREKSVHWKYTFIRHFDLSNNGSELKTLPILSDVWNMWSKEKKGLFLFLQYRLLAGSFSSGS